MKRRGGNDGFTLAELLVAAVLISVVMGAVYTAFYSSVNTWRLGEENLDSFGDARMIASVMRRDLYNMAPDSWHLFEGDENEMLFYTVAPPMNVETGVEPRILEVRYRLKRSFGEDESQLIREEAEVEEPLPPKPEDEGDISGELEVETGKSEDFVLSPRLLGMEIAYIYAALPEEEQERAPGPVERIVREEPEIEWDKPQAMRVVFRLPGGDDEDGVAYPLYLRFRDAPDGVDPEEIL